MPTAAPEEREVPKGSPACADARATPRAHELSNMEKNRLLKNRPVRQTNKRLILFHEDKTNGHGLFAYVSKRSGFNDFLVLLW